MNNFFLYQCFMVMTCTLLVVRFSSTSDAILQYLDKKQKVEQVNTECVDNISKVSIVFTDDISYEEKSFDKVFYSGKHESKIKAIYPHIILNESSDTFQSDLYFNQIVNDTMQSLENSFLEFEALASGEKHENSGEIDTDDYIGNFSSNYTIFFNSEKYISIAIHVSTYNGGAHGSYVTKTLNYDRISKKLSTLSDVCKDNYLDAISVLARYQLKQSFIEQNIMQDLDDWALNGTLPKEHLYEIWALTPNGLSITFPLYQVTAYCNGEQKITLPYEKLRDVFNLTF